MPLEPTQLTPETAQEILCRQKKFFQSGKTLPLNARQEQLDRLYTAIQTWKPVLEQALMQDLGKAKFESYTSEIGLVLADIAHTSKHLKCWMKPKKVKTPIYIFPARSRVEYTPYGSVFIMGPYNYPFQLVMEPLVGALAAGNCAVISPSELTPHVAAAIKAMLAETFAPEYVQCVDGSIENNTVLLHSPFDYIFFTGSVSVGKIVMAAAAENLIPVTLEMGGKSPVIVDRTARLEAACERIVWGKLMNAGQTCVAPDYVLVDRSIKEEFLQQMTKTIRRFYGEDAEQSPDFGRIVNQRHMQRLEKILENDKADIYYGGRINREKRYIEPTILCPKNTQAACMQEELFGPILPVFAYDKVEQAMQFIRQGETPLALYVFSENKGFVRRVLDGTASGGVSINDTISHITNPELPFGGKGHSGMGAYHGSRSFYTFSHRRSVLNRSTRVRLQLVFPPFSEKKYRQASQILK